MVLEGRRRQDAPAGRHDPRPAAAQASASSASTCSRRARSASCWRARAGTASSPSRPATRCTAPTNTPWSTAWKRCSAQGTTPAPCSIRSSARPRATTSTPKSACTPTKPSSTIVRWATATATPSCGSPRGEKLPDRVILLGLDIKMFYGGPKEAVMHGDLSPELRLHGHRHRPQARRRAVSRRQGDLGRLRRPGNLRQAQGRPEDPAAEGRLRGLLRLARPGRSDGKPRRREAGLHLRQGRPQDAASRAAPSIRGSCARAPRRFCTRR